MSTTEASPAAPSALLTEKQVSEILNCCEKTVFTLRKAGKIRAVKFGAAVRYTPSEVDRFINAQMTPLSDSTNEETPEAV